MQDPRKRLLVAVLAGALLAVAASPASTTAETSDFATDNQGCLGPLRSLIARGQFAGAGPFGEHFTGEVNPGAHVGTVGEEAFLQGVLGIEDVEVFCAQFETRSTP